MSKINRRHFLKTMGASAVLLSTGCALPKFKKVNSSKNYSPIDRSIADKAPRIFSGDDFTRPHAALWDKTSFLQNKGGIPAVSKVVDLAIVGGGMSGLFSAYLLRDFKPYLLEQAPRFGGNSKGQSWNGIEYSIGAAYFIEPDPGSEWEALLKELGVDKMWRVVGEEDPLIFNQKLFNGFWEGVTDQKHKQAFEKTAQLMKSVLNSTDGEAYPEIPYNNAAEKSVSLALDKITFHAWLKKKLGSHFHSHIETVIEHYCWSTFGSSSIEISAAAGLNNFAAEFGNTVVTSGGNSAISELLLEKVAASVPIENLRPGCLAVDVNVESDGVHIVFENAQGELEHILAKTAIMACPKFVVKKVVNGLEEKRLHAISKLKYRSYLVANVCLNTKISKNFYDMFIASSKKHDLKDIQKSSDEQNITDVILADYASNEKDEHSSVLTFYRALPYDGGRPRVYQDSSFAEFEASFRKQIEKEILPALGMEAKNIHDIRMTRWGHPMIVPEIGLMSAGVFDDLRKPFKEKLFFVEQDNWALPAIETSSAEAMYWAPKVRALLKS